MMKKEIEVNERIVLSDLYVCKGEMTHAINGKLHIVGVRPLKVTYNVLTGDVVIPEWFLIGDAETVAGYSELIKSSLESVVE